jgi:biopolymer transport protein ExbB/TolQ
MDIINFIWEHFAHAGPILVIGAISLGIFLERMYLLFMRYPMRNRDRFLKSVSSLVMSAKIEEATRLCDEYEHKPAAQVIKTALTRSHLPEGLIQDGLQLAIQEHQVRIMKRTGFLPTTANVATLLGLLGTIAGLIQSFQAVAHADPQQKSALLSAGISTAMNATMLGLVVAIPCMLAFSFLMSQSNLLVADCEQVAMRILDVLKQRFYTTIDAGEKATS